MKAPTLKTTAVVDLRDDYRCQVCGRSLHVSSGSRHHRQLRRHGDHSAANLILLCGSGTTGCHGAAHADPERARAQGIIVPSWRDAREVPVRTFAGWRLQREDGTIEQLTDAEAAQMMDELGLLA